MGFRPLTDEEWQEEVKRLKSGGALAFEVKPGVVLVIKHATPYHLNCSRKDWEKLAQELYESSKNLDPAFSRPEST